MTRNFIITGTDTGVGKTVFAAALTLSLDGNYFKPVQSGLNEETDTETVRRLTGLSADHFVPEIYRLKTPVSPHLAAEIDGVEIDLDKLIIPQSERFMIIEGAGGLHVPLTRRTTFIDVFARWNIPIILCARTALGTINHCLLSLEALRSRAVPVFGIAFIGDKNTDSERTICEMSGVRRLGRLPRLEKLDSYSLADAFSRHFNLELFANPDKSA